MRKTAFALALTAGALAPMTGSASAADPNYNTFGTTNGRSVIQMYDERYTCNPLAPTKPSDAFCKIRATGTFQTDGVFGPTHGTYAGVFIADYTGASAQYPCAYASGKIRLQVFNKDDQRIGSITQTLTPASATNPLGSRACATTNEDVKTIYFTGPLRGDIGGIPICGSAVNSGSNTQNYDRNGRPTKTTRDTANTKAELRAC